MRDSKAWPPAAQKNNKANAAHCEHTLAVTFNRVKTECASAQRTDAASHESLVTTPCGLMDVQISWIITDTTDHINQGFTHGSPDARLGSKLNLDMDGDSKAEGEPAPTEPA